MRQAGEAPLEGKPASTDRQHGLFESWIHLYRRGDPLQASFRNKLKVHDNNYFVTAWVVQLLLEAEALGTVEIDDRLVLDAVRALSTYMDRNRPGELAVNFWPQERIEGLWVSHPSNLIRSVEILQSVGQVTSLVHSAFGEEESRETARTTGMDLDRFVSAFRIPPDADDSSIHLSLGAALYRNRSANPTRGQAYRTWWNSSGGDPGALMETLLRYSYAPNSHSRSRSTIDPRTYYFLHSFLEQEVGDDPDFSIVTTWMLDLEESARLSPDVGMPFNVNNVDATVCANFVHGLASLAQSEMVPLESWFTEEIQNLLTNTTRYMTWVIESGRLLERPDIGLMYYPPIYDLYWFSSRSIALLSNQPAHPVIRETIARLEHTMETAGTRQLLSLRTSEDGFVFWDDFLGNGDVSLSGIPLERGEDRLYSTAVAVSALLETWTREREGTSSQGTVLDWKEETPAEVKNSVRRAVAWIETQGLAKGTRKENAVFSGSAKGMTSLPFFYPANVHERLNGKPLQLDRSRPGMAPDALIAMRGIVEKSEYEAMVDQRHFGVPTPTTFDGYNSAHGDQFPYWSSPALTYAVTLVALSKYACVEPEEARYRQSSR